MLPLQSAASPPRVPGLYPPLAVRLITQSDHIQLGHSISPSLSDTDGHPGFLQYSGVTGNIVITCLVRLKAQLSAQSGRSQCAPEDALSGIGGTYIEPVSVLEPFTRTDPAAPRTGTEPTEARSPGGRSVACPELRVAPDCMYAQDAHPQRVRDIADQVDVSSDRRKFQCRFTSKTIITNRSNLATSTDGLFVKVGGAKVGPATG